MSDRCPLGYLFQNLNLGKILTYTKYHLTISSVTSCQYQNFITIFFTVLEIGPFSHFRIRSSAKHRPMANVISQFLGLDLVNINVYAKVYQHMPLSSRDRTIFKRLRNDIIHRSRLCRVPNSEKVKMALSLELSGIL